MIVRGKYYQVTAIYRDMIAVGAGNERAAHDYIHTSLAASDTDRLLNV
jgi:hypothetical protein